MIIFSRKKPRKTISIYLFHSDFSIKQNSRFANHLANKKWKRWIQRWNNDIFGENVSSLFWNAHFLQQTFDMWEGLVGWLVVCWILVSCILVRIFDYFRWQINFFCNRLSGVMNGDSAKTMPPNGCAFIVCSSFY